MGALVYLHQAHIVLIWANIKELVGDKCESIMRCLSSSLHIARMFKLSGKISVGILDTYFNRYLILHIIEILLTYLRLSHFLMDSYMNDDF